MEIYFRPFLLSLKPIKIVQFVFMVQTQIMLGRDSAGKKKFFVWESEENGFTTSIEVQYY